MTSTRTKFFLLLGMCAAGAWIYILVQFIGVPMLRDVRMFAIENTKPNPTARESLETYFLLLHSKKYSEATAYHGSGYDTLVSWNPDLSESEPAVLLRKGCEQNGWQCLTIKSILQEEQVDADTFTFVVQFANNDGSLFTRGPCCGATEAEMPTQTDFTYVVRKTDRGFVVETAPVYVP